MSGRQRIPTGRNNVGEGYISARDSGISARSGRMVLGMTGTIGMSPATSARDDSTLGSQRSSGSGIHTERSLNDAMSSGRSGASNLSTGEVLRRMREKSDKVKAALESAQIEALGEYNPYSRPRYSEKMPLRSVLLDPEINNFPKARTASELRANIRKSGVPHPSYDLDGDGYVSQEDYRLAKRFDFDGNGVLDPDERKIGQKVLAEEFFRRHAEGLEKLGMGLSKKSHQENVDGLCNAYSFERAYEKLLEKERTLVAESSEPIMECMKAAKASQHQLAHNYYTNKLDATAYNDLDAVPRHTLTRGLDDHGGSRKRLLFTRKEQLRQETTAKLEMAMKELPRMCRVTLITNAAIEND